MNRETDFLLGIAFALLTQVRDYLAQKEDVNGVLLIEEQYLGLKSAIEQHYYARNTKEKVNGV